jgi:beta-glucosidase
MPTQPALAVRFKKLIDVDGFQFKDLNGNGELDPYEDWRLTPLERATDLVGRMTLPEKVGMMVINTRLSGRSAGQSDPTSHDGLIDERIIEAGANIFATRKVWPTSYTIGQLHIRHFILRENFAPRTVALWVNAMNEICEQTRLGIPCIIASNSRNEHAEPVFGMNDASGIFSTWPGTLGLAAAAKGEIRNGGDASIIDGFAAAARAEWCATGLRKGYMYMADVVTDPRWQRIYGTFGEDPAFIADVTARLIEGFQGSELGPTSVAMTTKHFPGGGARENGFDPHYKEGKWNCYPTPGSFETYHLPPFVAAVKTSSFMPYYSAPSIRRSVVQSYDGVEIPWEEVGFAFNTYIIEHLLRGQLGFTGYINSDSGITDNMCWGVENLTVPERFAKTVNAGTDIIADTNNVTDLLKAVESGWITEARIDQAVTRLLIEMFVLGLFDGQTYVDADAADRSIASSPGWRLADEAHRKSVTLLKNSRSTLPLAEGTTCYVEVFHKDPKKATDKTAKARTALRSNEGLVLVDDPADAEVAILLLDPYSGNYFSATPGLLELTICEDKDLVALDGSSYSETTITGVERFRSIATSVRDAGGRVVVSVNVQLPWILDDVEPLADAVVAGYETFYDAQFDVMAGLHPAVGVLPLTLPASEAVIAVDAGGRCVSPNDVPGYAKDRYLPKGLSYAYVDADGNRWVMGHGLRYE